MPSFTEDVERTLGCSFPEPSMIPAIFNSTACRSGWTQQGLALVGDGLLRTYLGVLYVTSPIAHNAPEKLSIAASNAFLAKVVSGNGWRSLVSSGKGNASLGSVFEAILGALFLPDYELHAAWAFLDRYYLPVLSELLGESSSPRTAPTDKQTEREELREAVEALKGQGCMIRFEHPPSGEHGVYRSHLYIYSGEQASLAIGLGCSRLTAQRDAINRYHTGQAINLPMHRSLKQLE